VKTALSSLGLHFASLSLLAFGGVNVVIPEIQRAVVQEGWMSDVEFSHLFAIAQAMPGPNVILAPLVGWRVAGLAGALVATGAMLLPSSLIVLALAGVWHRFRETRFVRAARRGLTPLTVGLVVASGWLLSRAAAHNLADYALGAVTVALVLTTKWNPIWLLLGGAALGVAGWV
jgi:chromate transporter